MTAAKITTIVATPLVLVAALLTVVLGGATITAPGQTLLAGAATLNDHAITLPRTAHQQYFATRHHPVPVTDLQPGDLLFWDTPTRVHHVALYTGNNHMIEAPQSGHPITHTHIRTTADYLTATRILTPP